MQIRKLPASLRVYKVRREEGSDMEAIKTHV